MQKKAINYFITGIGLVLGFLGLYFVKTMMDPQGFMKVLPYMHRIRMRCFWSWNGKYNLLQDDPWKSCFRKANGNREKRREKYGNCKSCEGKSI